MQQLCVIPTWNNSSILGSNPPPINNAEKLLRTYDRVRLSHCWEHHSQLLQYKYRLDDTRNLCQTAPHTTKHNMEDCVVLAPRRQEHNILDVRNLWVIPTRLIGYLCRGSVRGRDGNDNNNIFSKRIFYLKKKRFKIYI